MPLGRKQRKKLARKLEEARAAHEIMLERVDKARKKYDKRAARLHALEQNIAHLEQHYYAPDAEHMGQAAPEQDAARPARLIYNPEAGESGDSTQKLAGWVQSLRAHGIAAQVSVKTTTHSVRDLVREALDNDTDLLIVAGGDDTVEEVARELAGKGTALSILPTGMNNNLAQALGIPLGIDAACALIGMGTTRSLDVGQVIGGPGSREYFLESVGAGLGEIDGGTSLPHALRLYDIPVERVEVELDTGEIINPVTSIVTVSNAPLMGQNRLIAPDAKMDDGLLNVGIYEGMNAQEVLGYFNQTADQNPANGPKFYRARRVRIQAGDKGSVGAEAAQAGDLEIKVLPGACTAIVGKGTALSLPMQSVPSGMQSEESGGANNNGNNKPGLPLLGLFKKDK